MSVSKIVARVACAAALACAPVAGATPSADGRKTEGPVRLPDCSGFQKLLDDYLSVTSSPDAPLETRFDYARLNASPEGPVRLARIARELFGTTPSLLDAATRRAWAINAYNFLVIRTLTANLYDRPEQVFRSGKSHLVARRFESVRQIHLPEGSFFTAPVVEIEGVAYSLDSFERHFVFDGHDPAGKEPLPPTLDPRAHFAVVCAAKGCPPLLPRCYRADSLDAQLDFATRNALASPRHARWNADRGRLEASAIFDWYRTHFGGFEGALAFLRRHAPDEIRAVIEREKIAVIGATLPWDWSLNQTPDDES